MSTASSRAAYEQARSHRNTQQNQVVEAIEVFGPLGAHGIGNVTSLSMRSVSPRLSELCRKGVLRDSGREADLDPGREAIWELGDDRIAWLSAQIETKQALVAQLQRELEWAREDAGVA